ncbi:MAG: WYL domain-containing protein [Myxococcota bacterium]
MARWKNKEMLTRQLGHVLALQGVKRGLRVEQLVERCNASRATVYRDLETLEEAGVPIRTETVNGETRYLLEWSLPPLRPTPMQVAAILMLRQVMTPLEGTEILRELDGLLAAMAPPRVAELPVTLAPSAHPQVPGDVIRAMETAVAQRRRLAFLYRKPGGSPERRVVDPQELRLHEDQLYLVAFDTQRNDWRVFKPARAEQPEILDEPAAQRPDYDPQRIFANSMGIWSGDTVEVAVRIRAQVAPLIHEWPLSDTQTLAPQPDGAVVVRAHVAGTMEALHWVLRWGRNAEALEPAFFREQVRAELETALSPYRAPSHTG